MSVMPMKRINICGMRDERKGILESLQSMGVIEIDVSQLKLNDHFSKVETQSSIQQFRKTVEKLEQVNAVLDEFAPEKKGLLSMLDGKAPLARDEYERVLNTRTDILAEAGDISDLKRRYDDVQTSIGERKASIESLAPWMNLDISMSTIGTDTTRVYIGSIGYQATAQEIYDHIVDAVKDDETIPVMDINVVSSQKNLTCLTVVCHKDDVEGAEKALRSVGFTEPQYLISDVPTTACEKMTAEIASLEDEAAELSNQIRSHADVRRDVKILSDYFRMRVLKYEKIGIIPHSENVFILSGYIPQKEAGRVSDYLARHYTCSVEIVDLAEDEDPPVLLHNNYLASSVEGVLSSYGLPSKKDLDPTAIMFWFYVIFFGLMLSDAAYGAIMFIACLLARILVPNMSPGLKKSVRMFMYCGISTAVWGLLFGGFFGDVITVVSGTFFGHAVTLPALWFVPLEDPMRMLMYSLLFGVIHLYFGLGMKGWMCIKDKDYVSLISDVISWFLLITGLIMVLISTEFFYGIAGMMIHMPQIGVYISIGAAALGALILVFMGGRASKNPILRILLGVYEVYGITSWLSDILSYSRLLALGLATGVIAQVVNQMGSMFGKGPLGIILFIIIFIFGHTLNFAINLLGAYVHTNRLQYVEFFGKFYESGGRPFEPFIAGTKYVDVQSKEE